VIASFHNHSDWSDGQTGFGAMYTSADRQRVDILGLSDHFCIFPDGTSPDWSISPDRADEYVDEVVSYQGKGLTEVTVGAEFDWFENHGPILDPVLNALTLDYRIGSVHHVDRQQFDSSPVFWQGKTEEERDEVFAKYWQLVRGMAESMLFDIAAHLDLPKKFGFRPKSDMGPAIDAALDAIAASGMVVELNTAGFGRPCADAYPSLDILVKCRAREIPVTLSSDGHMPSHVLFEFPRGLARLREAGYSSLARFRGREAWFEPLDNALRSERE
jgi:histidinol-phosphatase (PHP family)